LLCQAGVRAALVQADARRMPFAEGTFGSASCFLGLQDVEIGYGQVGVREALAEAVRVLRAGGYLVLLDEFPLRRFRVLLDGLPLAWIDGAERELDVRWKREVAMRAVELYADGWVAQMRLPAGDRAAREAAYRDTLACLQSKVEAQIARRGTYVPFGPVRLVILQKVGTGRKQIDDET
jgi:SAM-dependent methyltransferase